MTGQKKKKGEGKNEAALSHSVTEAGRRKGKKREKHGDYSPWGGGGGRGGGWGGGMGGKEEGGGGGG